MPTFRPDIAQYAFQFGFADKLAPRLGATYDVRGDGKVKAFASWGRYYDWTKYEIARGSFGGDIWHIYYRSLDTLDIGSLNLDNMPGRDICGAARQVSATCAPRPSRTPIRTSSRCIRTASTAAWTCSSVATMALGVALHPQQSRPHDRGHGRARRRRQRLRDRQPGRGTEHDYPASYPATANFATPKPKRQYDALELTLEPPVLEELVRAARTTR